MTASITGMVSIPAPVAEKKFNVYAVINSQPLEKQTPKPVSREKASRIEERLTKGESKAARVLVVEA